MLSTLRSNLATEAMRHRVLPEDAVRPVASAERREAGQDPIAQLARLSEARLISKAIHNHAIVLREGILSTPQGVPVGTVAVRIVGLEQEEKQVPLGGVTMRLLHEGRERTVKLEQTTDVLGLASFTLGGAAKGVVTLVASSGSVIERARFEMSESEGLGTVIEVGPHEALAAAFAQGREVLEAAVKAVKELERRGKVLEEKLYGAGQRLLKTQEWTEAAVYPGRRAKVL
jgi:hypothetical protein